MPKYIYQHENWTDFFWEETSIRALFGEVKYLQGKINGIMNVKKPTCVGKKLNKKYLFVLLSIN